MATDLLDQLADFDVPPMPVDFDNDLHEKLNRSLTAQHLFDLLLRALPIAALEFARAVAGLLSLTVLGKFFDRSEKDAR